MCTGSAHVFTGLFLLAFVHVVVAAEKPDLLEAALEAQRQQNQPRVISCLQEFIKGSVGDVRVEKAREMLKRSWASYAAGLAKDGYPEEAAVQYLGMAKFLGAGPDAREATGLAKAATQKGFQAADRGRRYEEALGLAAAWQRLFKEEQPLADAAQILRFKIGILSGLVSQKAEAEYVTDSLKDVLAENGAEAALKEAKLPRWGVDFACAQKLAARGWHAAAIPILSELELSAPDEQSRKRVQGLMIDCLLGRADAWLSIGNVPEFQRAMNECKKYAGMPERNQRLLKLKRAGQRLAGGSSPQARQIAFKEPIPGEGVWNDEGGGLRINGEVRFGIQGKDARRADVRVNAGAVVEGGRLWVAHGRLAFEGLPDRPIVLRKVELVCEFVGQIDASNVIFEDCSFAKGGGMVWVGGYSSRWVFTDCLVVRSNFRGLGFDYGLKLSNTTFYDCEFSRRELGKNPVENAAARFMDDQNAVEECDFIRCRVSPSATWMTKRSNFYRCQLASLPDPFRSTENLEVTVFCPAPDARFRRQLELMSTSDDRGKILLSFAPKSLSRRAPPRLWPYVQAPPETMSRRQSKIAVPSLGNPSRDAADLVVLDVIVSADTLVPRDYEARGMWTTDRGEGKDTQHRSCVQMYLFVKRGIPGPDETAVNDIQLIADDADLSLKPGSVEIASWDVDGAGDPLGHNTRNRVRLLLRRGQRKWALTDVLLHIPNPRDLSEVGAPAGYRMRGWWDCGGESADTMGRRTHHDLSLCAK